MNTLSLATLGPPIHCITRKQDGYTDSTVGLDDIDKEWDNIDIREELDWKIELWMPETARANARIRLYRDFDAGYGLCTGPG